MLKQYIKEYIFSCLLPMELRLQKWDLTSPLYGTPPLKGIFPDCVWWINCATRSYKDEMYFECMPRVRSCLISPFHCFITFSPRDLLSIYMDEKGNPCQCVFLLIVVLWLTVNIGYCCRYIISSIVKIFDT